MIRDDLWLARDSKCHRGVILAEQKNSNAKLIPNLFTHSKREISRRHQLIFNNNIMLSWRHIVYIPSLTCSTRLHISYDSLLGRRFPR